MWNIIHRVSSLRVTRSYLPASSVWYSTWEKLLQVCTKEKRKIDVYLENSGFERPAPYVVDRRSYCHVVVVVSIEVPTQYWIHHSSA